LFFVFRGDQERKFALHNVLSESRKSTGDRFSKKDVTTRIPRRGLTESDDEYKCGHAPLSFGPPLGPFCDPTRLVQLGRDTTLCYDLWVRERERAREREREREWEGVRELYARTHKHKETLRKRHGAQSLTKKTLSK